VKGSRSEPDADEDRDGGVDEGGEDAEGPWGDERMPGVAQATTSQRSPFNEKNAPR